MKLCAISCVNADMTSLATWMISCFGKPEVAQRSYDCLYKILQKVGLTISQNKLVPPDIQVTCLGVMIDIEKATISILSEKLKEICGTIQEWSG